MYLILILLIKYMIIISPHNNYILYYIIKYELNINEDK